MNSVRVLSLGAGVQSSALLLMCDRGLAKPVDFAVFADVQAEPAHVYEWLEKLKRTVKTKIIIDSRGNIHQEVVEHWRGERKRCGQPPLYALDAEKKRGMLRRHCTKEYKIEVVDRGIRTELNYRPRQKWKHQVQMVMGISYDEMQRMKVPSEKWKSFEYPLIDAKLRRADCIEIVKAFGLGEPPRSACYFCPYKTNVEWRLLRDRFPADWQKAVEFDRAIRKSPSPKLTSEFFVHRDRVPLDQADLGSTDEGQYSMQDECEGMCGI